MAEARRAPKKPLRDGGIDDSRKKLMIAVRAACRRLGIDDDTRKAMQKQVVKKASMSDMSIAELGKLLDHLNRDWKGPMGHRAHIGKIKALWWTLYWLGKVESPGDHAISAFVERQTGVSALAFLDHRKAPSVIEALKSWCERAGVVWPTPESTAARLIHNPHFTALLDDRHSVLRALETKLQAHGEIRVSYYEYLQKALGLVANHYWWTAQELDAGIRLLGKKHRRLIEAGN